MYDNRQLLCTHLGPKLPILLFTGCEHCIEDLDADGTILIHAIYTIRIYTKKLTIYRRRAMALTRELADWSVFWSESMTEGGVFVGESGTRAAVMVAFVDYSEPSKTGADFDDWGRNAREVGSRRDE